MDSLKIAVFIPLVHNNPMRKTVANIFAMFSAQPSQMDRPQRGAKILQKIQHSEYSAPPLHTDDRQTDGIAMTRRT